jgi:hypothetical protein
MGEIWDGWEFQYTQICVEINVFYLWKIRKRKTMNRKQLIAYIRRHDSFYSHTEFAGHSDEQLKSIKIRIDLEMEKKQKTKKGKEEKRICP